jgi:hypothetical protein
VATGELKGYVYRAASPLQAEDLAGLLKAHFTRASAIVKRIDWADVVCCNVDESLIENWTEGQVFSVAAELRWRKTASGYAALWLTEQPIALEGFVLLEDSPYTAACPSKKTDHGFLLWGTRQDKNKTRWWEARIPRPLRYEGLPVNKNSPPHLSYRLYWHGETVRWTRLLEFVEVNTNE